MRRCRLRFRPVTAPAAVLLAALGTAAAAASDPFASEWAKGLKSAARIVASGDGGGGAYRAGIEIELDPNTITYWRNPGDAGAPPVVSFEGSDNVGSALMLLPAPQRLDEAGAEAFGYEDDVIFPLRITARDPALPVSLHVKLDYAACGRICIPARAEAQLTLPQAAGAGPYAGRIGAFEARVPVRQALGADAPLTIAGLHGLAGDVGAGKARFSVTGRVPANSGPVDIFAEAPEGWYLETEPVKPGPDGAFTSTVAIVQAPKSGSIAGLPVVFTLVAGERAIEVTAHLDAAGGAL